MNKTSEVAPHQKELFGHPIGLFVLFFTEMWERFSYYGMRAIFILYLVKSTSAKNPGLGWSNTEALALYGWYTMLVYVASIPGGILADKIFGQKKAVIIGASLLVIGHSVLAIEQLWAFYTGLAFIILGVGLLKPNISTMVGGLYKKEDIRRDEGFSIFYIGINIGALLSGLTIGTVGEVYGWHLGFGLAGVLMLLGLIQFVLGQKYLVGIGEYIGKEKSEKEKEILNKPLTKIEKDRVLVLILSFFMIIVFFAAFEQAGGLMSIYTKEKTNRVLMGFTVPTSWFQSLNAFFIITLGIAIANFWAKRKLKNKEASSIFKMIIGLILIGLGFFFMSFAALQYESEGASAMYWLFFAYLFHTIGELCLSPVSMSFITKLAPLKYASSMMGLYWAIIGTGSKLAGLLGESASEQGELTIFTSIAIFCIAFGLLARFFLKKLKILTHGAEDNEK